VQAITHAVLQNAIDSWLTYSLLYFFPTAQIHFAKPVFQLPRDLFPRNTARSFSITASKSSGKIEPEFD
jgi:hypothetical protein